MTSSLLFATVCNWKKEGILSAWEKRAQAKTIPTTADIKIPTPASEKNESNIYVNEHLTAYSKGLLKRARDLRARSIKFVWTKSCKVLLRVTESNPVIVVKNAEVLKKVEEDLLKQCVTDTDKSSSLVVALILWLTGQYSVSSFLSVVLIVSLMLR